MTGFGKAWTLDQCRAKGLDVAALTSVSIAPKRSKYHNIRTQIPDGRWADSKIEARRWSELLLLKRAHQINNLEFHPIYQLDDVTYEADAAYFDIRERRKIVEDVKGVETPRFRVIKTLWRKHGPFELHILTADGKGWKTMRIRSERGRNSL